MVTTPPDVLIFDMDGVLVEVGDSYREAIREVVQHFTGDLVSHDLIQDYKNEGGWNNDWLLTQRLIADRGVDVQYPDVVNYFNQIFLGANGDGLIQREKWMPAAGFFERLQRRSAVAIFTGRAKYEAEATLQRYAPSIIFDPLVTDDSVASPKPAPDGLDLIKRLHPGKGLWYLGDTVDDARSAAAAGVPFIGVSVTANSRHEEITRILYSEGAFTVIEDVNQLEKLVEESWSLSGSAR